MRYILFYISIHRMFRFYAFYNVELLWSVVFQYIVCFGSTPDGQKIERVCFSFQYIVCFGSTTDPAALPAVPGVFQYIVCFGSTGKCLLQQSKDSNFNTSYVSVLHVLYYQSVLVYTYFNTSYVSVLQRQHAQGTTYCWNFNTSYVSVLPLFLCL